MNEFNVFRSFGIFIGGQAADRVHPVVGVAYHAFTTCRARNDIDFSINSLALANSLYKSLI